MFSSSLFRSVQSRSVLFRSVLDNDIETHRCLSVFPFQSVHNNDTERQSTSMDWQGSQKYDAFCPMSLGKILHAMASF